MSGASGLGFRSRSRFLCEAVGQTAENSWSLPPLSTLAQAECWLLFERSYRNPSLNSPWKYLALPWLWPDVLPGACVPVLCGPLLPMAITCWA